MNTIQLAVDKRTKKVRSDAILIDIVCTVCGRSATFTKSAAKKRRTCGDSSCRYAIRSRASKEKMGALAERFKNYYRVVESGCWEWTATINQDGYGRIMDNGKVLRAHRVSMLLHGIALSEDQQACHTCDNTICVNPSHLYAGTHKENMADRDDRGRTSRGERQGLSKLTVSAIKEIRQLFLSEPSDAVIASRFGVSPPTIWAVRNRKTWKHVE